MRRPYYQWWQRRQKDDPTPNVSQYWQWFSHADRLSYAEQIEATERVPMSPTPSQSCLNTGRWKKKWARPRLIEESQCRTFLCEGVRFPAYKSGSGAPSHMSAKKPPHWRHKCQSKTDREIWQNPPESHTWGVSSRVSHKHQPCREVGDYQWLRTTRHRKEVNWMDTEEKQETAIKDFLYLDLIWNDSART